MGRKYEAFNKLLERNGLEYSNEEPDGFFEGKIQTDGKIQEWEIPATGERLVEVYSSTATICGNTIYADSKRKARAFLLAQAC